MAEKGVFRKPSLSDAKSTLQPSLQSITPNQAGSCVLTPDRVHTYVRIPRTYNKRMLDSHQQEPVGYIQELPGMYLYFSMKLHP